MGLFTQTTEEKAERARARLVKLEANRERIRVRMAGAELRYHKVNSGRGVGGVLAGMQGGKVPQQRRDAAAQGLNSLASELEVTERRIAAVRAEAGLPPEAPEAGGHGAPEPGR